MEENRLKRPFAFQSQAQAYFYHYSSKDCRTTAVRKKHCSTIVTRRNCSQDRQKSCYLKPEGFNYKASAKIMMIRYFSTQRTVKQISRGDEETVHVCKTCSKPQKSS